MSEIIRNGLADLSEDEIDMVAGGQDIDFGNFQGQQFQNTFRAAFINFQRNQFGQASFGNTTTPTTA